MEKLKEWEYFVKGKQYNNKLDPPYYDTVKVNLDFYNDKQWRNLKAENIPKPQFNIIKRAVTFFVASIMSNKVKVNYEPLTYVEEDNSPDLEGAEIANAEVENLFAKFDMESKLREVLTDGAVMGDKGAHIYFNREAKPYGNDSDVMGEIDFELIDGTNIYLGNPNNHLINTRVQPYVIISGRDTVENLKYEAKQYKQDMAEVEALTTDKNNEDMIGDIEIESDDYGKAQYIIFYKYDKEKKTILKTKCTDSAYIYKDVDTGLNEYPVAWFVWEKQKNQYHGKAVCTGMIPNQIFINRMFAMVMYHLMMSAFPKPIYDSSKIPNWNNEIGTAIAVDNASFEGGIKSVATYLEPANMSNQIVQVLELAMNYTKETLGINDAMLGNINPEQASGKSIVATVQQATVPLENNKANLFQFVKDIGKILLDMIGTYYGFRPIVLTTPQGKEMVNFDFSVFKDMGLKTKCEVGPGSYWSELAGVQTLDNLFQQGSIDIIDYLESIPEGYIPDKEKLIDKIKLRQEQALQQAMNIPTEQMPMM